MESKAQSIIFKDPGTFEKPSVLFHEIAWDAERLDEAYDAILAQGLIPQNDRWTDINELLPQRPYGVFMSDEHYARKICPDYAFKIAVGDLDKSKLVAFPTVLAYAANAAACGHELVEGTLELAAETAAVPYEEFDGSFDAEWIYLGTVPASVLQPLRDWE